MLPTAKPGLPCRAASMPIARLRHARADRHHSQANHDRRDAEPDSQVRPAANQEFSPNQQPGQADYQQQNTRHEPTLSRRR